MCFKDKSKLINQCNYLTITFTAELYVKIISGTSDTEGEIAYTAIYELKDVPLSFSYLKHAVNTLFAEGNRELLKSYSGRGLFYFSDDAVYVKVFDELVVQGASKSH